MATDPNQSNDSPPSVSGWVNKYTLGAIAVVATVAATAYTLTQPTKPKKPRRARPANQPRTKKYEKRFDRKPLDIHMVMRDLNDGFHAHVAADKKNKNADLVVGSALIKINGEKVENASFETILTKLQQARLPTTLSFREFPELEAKWVEADGLKEAANEKYKKNQMDEALQIMQQAIDLHPTNKVYYSNRVLMLLKRKDHDQALSDCQIMRELDPLSSYVKGHYVRGLVLMNLEKYKHARSAFQTVLKINSKFKKAAERLEECMVKLNALEAEDQKVVDEKDQEILEEPAPAPVVEAQAVVVPPEEQPAQPEREPEAEIEPAQQVEAENVPDEHPEPAPVEDGDVPPPEAADGAGEAAAPQDDANQPSGEAQVL